MEVIKNYMKLLELEERMVVDENDWRRRIHVLRGGDMCRPGGAWAPSEIKKIKKII